MKEHPIIFSTPMIKAILESRKSQTRRVIKPQPDKYAYEAVPSTLPNFGDLWDWHRKENNIPENPIAFKCPYGTVKDRLWVITIKTIKDLENYGVGDDGNAYRIKNGIPKKIKPSKGGYRQRYYQVKIGVGSKRRNYYVHRLVCESFYGECPPRMEEVRHLDGNSFNNIPQNLDWGTKKQNSLDRVAQGNITSRKLTPLEIEFIKSCEWRAGLSIPQCAKRYGVNKGTIENIIYGKSWNNRPIRPSRNLSAWAFRITLEITDIRVERLQEISEEDAIKEGIFKQDGWYKDYGDKTGGGFEATSTKYPRESFKTLWVSIHRDNVFGWDKNPFVWVLEFKRIKA